ncbi:MAG TPA: hypothetical protein VGL58_11940 [Caulobacteraceae bacterium]|jgi:hypothetical protein
MTSTSRPFSLPRRTLLAIVLATASLLALARAHAESAPVDLQVVDRDTGQTLQVWRHDGRLYVAGAPGDRYGLRVTNRTGGRVLVVMSVDGVNILTGETAGYDQRGYIFDPHESYDLNGWRKSTSEIADFTFTRLPNSYAARTGRPANVGVIGIAVFDEAPPVVAETPPVEDDREADASRLPEPAPAPANAPSGAAGSGMVAGMLETPSPPKSAPGRAYAGRDTAEEKLGTGHGEREWSETTVEPFERATSYPQYTQQIAYDSYDNLLALGVIRPSWRYGERQPQPFPQSGDGFVPDPPGRP